MIVLALLIALLSVLLVAAAAPCKIPLPGPTLALDYSAHKKGESVDSPLRDNPDRWRSALRDTCPSPRLRTRC